MTPRAPKPQTEHPYGTDPTRPRRPAVILGILYGLWFVFLLWTAIDRVISP